MTGSDTGTKHDVRGIVSTLLCGVRSVRAPRFTRAMGAASIGSPARPTAGHPPTRPTPGCAVVADRSPRRTPVGPRLSANELRPPHHPPRPRELHVRVTPSWPYPSCVRDCLSAMCDASMRELGAFSMGTVRMVRSGDSKLGMTLSVIPAAPIHSVPVAPNTEPEAPPKISPAPGWHEPGAVPRPQSR